MKDKQVEKIISINQLTQIKYGKILCYPRFEKQEHKKRLIELEKFGIQNLEFVGKNSVYNFPVLGKGCVGIVVKVYIKNGKAALKIRRTDADRNEMFHEGKMLEIVNNIKVGPKLLNISKNFLLMELIEGKHFPEWLESIEKRECDSIDSILKKILEQCYKLDKTGLDHGELSNARKHILVDKKDNPYIVDFESASTNRKVSNVTSICQFLFLRTQMAKIVKNKIHKFNEDELIKSLRNYKKKRTRNNFEKIRKLISKK